MYELPLREKEVRCEVGGGQVVQVLRPLTDEQYHALYDTSKVVQGEEGISVQWRVGNIPGLYEDRLIRIEGLAIAGEPFDPANGLHLESVPQLWKRAALIRLVTYANGLSEAERGNSNPPAEPSPTEATPSQDSVGGNSA